MTAITDPRTRSGTVGRGPDRTLEYGYEDLMALSAISMALGQPGSLEGRLVAALDVVLALVGSRGGCVHLMNEEKGLLSLVARRGLPEEVAQALRIVALADMPVGDDLPARYCAWLEGMGEHCLACVPLVYQDVALGLLTVRAVSSGERAELDAGRLRLLHVVGRQVGVAIENERLAREAAEVQVAREVDQLRTQLIGNVSHELRTPLGIIKAAATTLLAEDVTFDDETQGQLLRGIDEEADRLARLVDNLLDLSRMEQRGAQLERSFVDLGRLIAGVVAAMQLQETGCHLEVDVDGSPVADIDEGRIEQVLRNLLDNAVKYSPDGGTITIRGRIEGRHVLVSVSDEGIGIPPGELERVFLRFYRVENQITRAVRGAGMGLAICRQIVEAHGGEIWAESVPGGGSTFTFALLAAEFVRPAS